MKLLNTADIMEDTGDPAMLMEGYYREIGPELLAWLKRRHRDPQVAEDLLQETFAAAMKDPGRLIRADSPRAYLFGVARHLSMDVYRRGSASKEAPLEPESAEEETEGAKLEAMRDAIVRLDAKSRQVLELRLQRELSYEEIAAALRVPVGTVRSRLHYAVRQLRERLRNYKYDK